MATAKKILKLEMSEATYTQWYDKLYQYFQDKGMTPEQAAEKVKSVLTSAQEGWPHAPLALEVRIKMKSGYKWKSHNNLVSNADHLPSVIRHEEKVDKTIRDMYQWETSLNEKEMSWWKDRENEYKGEFEFNKSSDKPLLFQLLVEELTQRRIGAKMLKEPEKADAYSKLMTDSLKRLQDTQTKLGITREQRADAIDNKSGDVSSLSVDLDEKFRRAKAKVEEWAQDTKKNKFRKGQEAPMNQLPPISKIEALLGIDNEGNLGENIQTDDMSDLVEEASKIHEEMLITEETEPSMREPDAEDSTKAN